MENVNFIEKLFIFVKLMMWDYFEVTLLICAGLWILWLYNRDNRLLKAVTEYLGSPSIKTEGQAARAIEKLSALDQAQLSHVRTLLTGFKAAQNIQGQADGEDVNRFHKASPIFIGYMEQAAETKGKGESISNMYKQQSETYQMENTTLKSRVESLETLVRRIAPRELEAMENLAKLATAKVVVMTRKDSEAMGELKVFKAQEQQRYGAKASEDKKPEEKKSDPKDEKKAG